MQSEYAHLLANGKPAAGAISTHFRQRLQTFVAPLLTPLDRHLDARLVRTFAATLEALLCFRHRNYGLLLSELGGYLAEPDHAPAGTKRLSNLLRSAKWTSALIGRFLWDTATTHVQALAQAEEEVLLLWNESVLEKPESLRAEGLGFVRSSKAARLKRIKPGFYLRRVARPSLSPVFPGSVSSSPGREARRRWRPCAGGPTAPVATSPPPIRAISGARSCSSA
jgi:hypothetical protein